jgi:Icc-related predicted phosphoesterase
MPKLLLFSDLHCDATAARSLVERSRSVDIVIGAGDFANMRRGLGRCLEVLKEIDRPAVLVAGNNETTDELRDASRDWPAAVVLHGNAAEIGGLTFFGLGGGVPVTPFGAWSYDLSEEEAASQLARCPGGCILVTHSPPKTVVDVSSRGDSLGSTAIRDAIVRTRPRLAVCGHIHASGGQQGTLGETPVVNAGPAGIVWSLD